MELSSLTSPQLPAQPHRESKLPFWISHNPTFSLHISEIFQQVLNAHFVLLRSNQHQQPGKCHVLEIRQGYLVEKTPLKGCWECPDTETW